METTFYILAKTVQICLDLVSIAMVVRMLLPIFIEPEGNRLFAAACFISEPFVMPVRLIMAKLNVGQNTPIDVAFMIAYFVVWLLGIMLPAI